MLARSLSKVARSVGGADNHKYPNGSNKSMRSVCSSGEQPSTRRGVKTVDPSTTTWSTARKSLCGRAGGRGGATCRDR